MNVARNADLLSIMAVDAIRQTLYDPNDFLQFMRDFSSISMQAKEVQFVRKGARVPVGVNSPFAAGTVFKTKASLAKFGLDVYDTAPEAIPQEEIDKLVYDKKSEQMDNHALSIQDRFANETLHKMLGTQTVVLAGGAATTEALPTENIIFTSGDVVSGKRQIRLEDMKDVQNAIVRAKLPRKGWKMLADVDLESQIYLLPNILKAQEFGGTAVLPEGVLARLLGMDFVESRSYVPHYTLDAEPTVVPLEYIVDEEDANKFTVVIPDAETSRRSIIFWHPDLVAKAIGLVETFFKDQDPIYKADIFAMQAYAGCIRILNQAVFVITEGIEA